MRTRSENKQTAWSAGKRKWQFAMVSSLHFISCEDDASFPITEQSKVKPMQSRITFDTRLKNDPYQYKKKNAYLIVSSTGNHKP